MSINNQAFTVLNRFADAMNEGVKQLRQGLIDAGIATVEDAEPVVVEWAAQRYACPLVDGKGKATGRKVLDNRAETYEAARKAKQRVMEALRGDTTKSPKSEADAAEAAEEFAVPTEIAAAAAALVALVNEYDLKAGELKKLAARAVAEAFAAAQ